MDSQMMKDITPTYNENLETQFSKLDISQLKKIYTLEKVDYAQMQLVMDEVSKKQFIKKQFNNQQDYLQEMQLVKELEQKFGKEIQNTMCKLEFADESKSQLIYEAGMCFLQDFSNVRNFYNVYWWNKEQELVHILKKVLYAFKSFHEKNLFFSDLNPQNIIMYISSDLSSNIYDIKLMNFKSATFDFKQVNILTKEFCYPNLEHINILSKEERVKYEYYTLGRTIQKLMLGSICKVENMDLNDMFSNDQASIQQCFKIFRQYYSESLVNILADILEMKVQLDIIEQKLIQIKSDNIIDSEQLIDNMVYEKMNEKIQKKEGKKIEDQFEEYFQLELYDKIIQIFKKMDESKYKSIKLVTLYMQSLYSLGDFGSMNLITELLQQKYEQNYNTELNDEYLQYNFAKIKGLSYYKGEEIMLQLEKQIIEKFGENSLQLGHCYYYLSEYQVYWQKHNLVEETIEKCRKQTLFMEKCKNQSMNINRFLGLTQFRQKHFSEAIKFYTEEKQEREQNSSTQDTNYGLTLQNIAVCQMELGQYDEATKNYQQAAELVRKTRGICNLDYQNILHNIGANYYNLGNKELAIKYLEQCLISRVKYKNYSLDFLDQDTINNLNWIGYINSKQYAEYFRNNIINQCTQYILQKNYVYANIYTIISRKLIMSEYNYNSLSSNQKEEFESEIDCLEKITNLYIEAQKQLDYSKVLIEYQNIDQTLSESSQNVKSKDYFPQLQLQSTFNIVDLLLQQKQYSEAHEKLEQFQANQQNLKPEFKIKVMQKSMQLLERQFKQNEALALAQEALKIAETNKLEEVNKSLKIYLLQLLYDLRNSCLQKSETAEAVKFLKQELVLTEQIQGKYSLDYLNLAFLLAQQDECINDHDESQLYYKTVYQITNELIASNNLEKEIFELNKQSQSSLQDLNL